MKKLAYLIAVGLIAIAQIFPRARADEVVDLQVNAITPTQTLPAPTLRVAEPDTEPATTPVVETCLDCFGGAATDEDELLLLCSPDNLADNPQDADLCYSDELFWSCDPDGWCESDGFDDPTGEGYDW